MFGLQFKVIVLITAGVTSLSHAASIIPYSRQQRAAYPCQIFPSEYDFLSGGGHNSQNYMQNCSNSTHGQTDYMACTTPALLTNSQCGPELYNSTEQEQYYHIIQRQTQILFSFPRLVTLMDIKIDYYSDVVGNKSLPRVSIHNVNTGFNVMDQPTKTSVTKVGPKVSPPGETGLAHEIIPVNIGTRKVLLKFDELQYQFYLSEVSFFSCTLESQTPSNSQLTSEPPQLETTTKQPSSKTTTEPSHSETTAHQAQRTTTRTPQHITLHNQPSPIHTITGIAVSEYEKAASTTLHMLPWVLLGVMVLLFSILLMANIICCMILASRKYKKKHYTLKSNPCYIASSRPLNTQNFTVVDHIYAVPTK